MKKIIALLIALLPAAHGVVTNYVRATNAVAVYSRPDGTGQLLASPTNGSLLEIIYPWGPWVYGTVLEGSHSGESGWVWYDLLSSNRVPNHTNQIANGGGQLLSAPSTSTRTEAGTASVRLAPGTKVNLLTNLGTEWVYCKVNSGVYSNSNGYFPIKFINTNAGATNAVVTNQRIALRTTPRPQWYGNRLGTTSYLTNTLSFVNLTNGTIWYYVTRGDFTNGYVSNALLELFSITN